MNIRKTIVALQLLFVAALTLATSHAADKPKYSFVIDIDKIVVNQGADRKFHFAPGGAALVESLSRISGAKVTLVSDKYYIEDLTKVLDTLELPSGRNLGKVVSYQSRGIMDEVSSDSRRQPLNPDYRGRYKRDLSRIGSRWDEGNTIFIDDNPTQLMHEQEIAWLKVNDAGAPGENARVRGLIEEAIIKSKKTGQNLQESLQSVQWTNFSVNNLHTAPHYDSERAASGQVYEVGEKILKETDETFAIPEDVRKTLHPSHADLFEGKTSDWSSEPFYSRATYGVEAGPKTAPPIDFVFDLDKTIIFKDRHYEAEHAEGKPVGASTVDAEGDTYTISPGAAELLQSLSKIPGARISLFSAATNSERNNAIAFKLRLPDGRLLKDILYNVVSGKSTTLITDDNKAELQPAEEIFVGKKKKDLRKIDPAIDVSRAILIDDKPKNMIKGQEHSILFQHNDTANGEVSRVRGIIQEAIDKSAKEGISIADALYSIQFKKDADGKIEYDVKAANSAELYKKGEALLQAENPAFKLPATVLERVASAPEEAIKPKPEQEKKPEYSSDSYYSSKGYSSSYFGSSYGSGSSSDSDKKRVNFVIDVDKILVRKEGGKYTVVPGAMELVHSLSEIPDSRIHLYSDNMSYSDIKDEMDSLKLPNGKRLSAVIEGINSTYSLTSADRAIGDRIKNPMFLGEKKKDLTKVGSWGRNLDNVILIDDNPSLAVQEIPGENYGQEKNMLIVNHESRDGEAARIRAIVGEAQTVAKREKISLKEALWKIQFKRLPNGHYEYVPRTSDDYVAGEALLQKSDPDYHLPAGLLNQIAASTTQNGKESGKAESARWRRTADGRYEPVPFRLEGGTVATAGDPPRPIDFVFDLDKVLIFSREHAPKTMDLVPLKGRRVSAVGRDYILAPGAAELIASVSQIPGARVSIFSDSKYENRNWEILKKISLPDGRTLADVVEKRVYSAQDMKSLSTWSSRSTVEAAQPKSGNMFQGRQKKDLDLPHPQLDLSRTILVDDDATSMARAQEKSLLFTSHATTYGETSRVRGLIEAAIQKSDSEHIPLTDALWKLQWKVDHSGNPEYQVEAANSEAYYHEGARLLTQTNPEFKLDPSVFHQLGVALEKLNLAPPCGKLFYSMGQEYGDW